MSNTFRRLLLPFLLLACLSAAFPAFAQDSPQAADLDGDVALAWMDMTYRLVQSQAVNAPAASRIYAYAGVTLYEAVVNGMPDNSSLASQFNTMPEMPLPKPDHSYDWASVANGALARALAGLFDAPSEETLAAIRNLRAEQVELREAEIDPETVTLSLKYGESIADLLLDWIAEDGYLDTLGQTFDLPTGAPELYVRTTNGAPLVGAFWGELRPFGLQYTIDCDVAPNMPFDTDVDSAFYAQALEVKEAGDNLTDEQKEIARFWLDTPGVTGAPAGHWVSIENQLVTLRDLNLQQAAAMYALVGMALGDSFISTWRLKYEVLLLRPETYIHNYIRSTWQPYIQTPPFPEYPSGHSVASAAAAEVLTSLFGVVAFTDRTHLIYDHEPLQRAYTSFEAAASEAAISRLYGGIHYREAIENGLRQGRCIGQAVIDNIQLGPIPQGE
ncbi:MAG: vanadium-dependent haloperoxidase [Chloroflexota bacterium]